MQALRGRRARIAGGAALVATAALLVWWLRAAPEVDAGFVTEAVDRGLIQVTVTATGTLQPVTTVQVGTYVSGPVIELFADYNSPVQKGQRVAKIDPRPFEVKVQQAEANVATARAQVVKSRADRTLKQLNYSRSRELRQRNMIAQNELDAARSEFEQADAQVALDQAGQQQAESQLEEARINLGYTDITSPVDGVVVSRSVDVGQTVAASFQTPTLFLIAQDLTKMQVIASVSESDIGEVHEGQPAEFSVDAFPERRFTGRVAQVRNAPVVLQNVVTYAVVIEVANPDLALKPGMTAAVSITIAVRDDALRVPLRALRFRPDGAAPDAQEPGVYQLGARGALERVSIQVGLRDDAHVELLGGDLAAGDAVVVSRQRSAEPDREPVRSPFQPRRLR